VGSGPSAARILISRTPLKSGSHTLQTTDPDTIHTFTVVPSADVLPPRLEGNLSLDASNAPEPSSECPDTIFIRARFRVPQDDRTHAADLTYFVWIRRDRTSLGGDPDVVLPAEAIAAGEATFRFGEAGCGCIPHVPLEPGTTYRITLRAVDAAGHESVDALSGTVRVPKAGDR
jgi:hypothetical protein